MKRSKKKRSTYKSSGVDVELGNAFVKKIKVASAKTLGKGALSPIGGFGGLYDIKSSGYRDPILVSSADGVGTKLMLAISMEKFDTVGIDAVAMNVNDILTLGARPLFFLDYLALGKLDLETSASIVSGVAKGCALAGCSLIGGETAEMPGIYRKNDFDLAGFCVGAVEKGQEVTGKNISEGDVIIGLKSSGFHSNGFSLIRKVIKDEKLDLKKKYKGFRKPLGKYLLEPTRIYVESVLGLLKKTRVKGLAHITGGGFPDKLGRIIPEGLCAVVNRNMWRLPLVFRFIREKGNIADDELYRVFNCGIGFVIVVGQANSRSVMDHFGTMAVEIGYVEKNQTDRVVLL